MNLARIAPLLIIAGALAAADDAAAAAALWKDKVQPLLAERCYDCHGPKKQKHGLRLDTPEGIAKGGKEQGPAVIAGKPDESPIIKVVQLPLSEDEAMPPKGDRITPEQLGWLKAWIAGGAPTGAAK